MELAGENRPELEAVLQHYSTDKADSLKYRAARFLIENLPLHYGYAGKGLEDFKCDYDSLFCDKDIPRQVLRGRAKNYNPDFTNVHPAFDLSELSRDFLIRHIDNAFATLDYPWTKGRSAISVNMSCLTGSRTNWRRTGCLITGISSLK